MMEAKDTVMTVLQLHQKPKDKSYLEAQAEISFKAGKVEGMRLYSTWFKDKLVDKREVSLTNEEWQAKLKEWRIK